MLPLCVEKWCNMEFLILLNFPWLYSRGIDVVRDRIKSFAKEKVDLPPGRHKIVILDEVDAMTEVAQQVRFIVLVQSILIVLILYSHSMVGTAPLDGGSFRFNTICISLQSINQNYWAHPKSLCNHTLWSFARSSSTNSFNGMTELPTPNFAIDIWSLDYLQILRRLLYICRQEKVSSVYQSRRRNFFLCSDRLCW